MKPKEVMPEIAIRVTNTTPVEVFNSMLYSSKDTNDYDKALVWLEGYGCGTYVAMTNVADMLNLKRSYADACKAIGDGMTNNPYER